jgi:hypothetical protein
LFREKITGDVTPLPEHEMAVFCNLDRLQRRIADPLHVYDNKLDRLVGKTDGCAGAVFMYTTRFQDKPDTIQICPWFLEYAKARTYDTNTSLTSLRAWLAVRGLDRLITNHFYTPIDLMSLWDKCMLHEMMHTMPAGPKNDVGGADGYGWKNCRKLSTKPDALLNADSFAIFGSALFWSSQGSPIDENGEFTSGPASKRWLGSGAGRGLDAIKLHEAKPFM